MLWEVLQFAIIINIPLYINFRFGNSNRDNELVKLKSSLPAPDKYEVLQTKENVMNRSPVFK